MPDSASVPSRQEVASAPAESLTSPTQEEAFTQEEAAAGFVLRLGRALHSFGYTANGLEDVLTHVTNHLGLIGQFFSTPTSIFAAFGPIERQRTHLIRVEPGDVNLGKLAAVDEVSAKVLRGDLSPAEGSQRIDAIVDAPPQYGMLFQLTAFGLASATSCRILGGGMAEVALSTFAGLMTGILFWISQDRAPLRRVFEFVAAFLVSGLVHVMAADGFRASTAICVLAGLIVLVPGLSVTLALAELASRHLAAGTARLAGAFVVFIGIIFGVALGAEVASRLVGDAPTLAIRPLPTWTLWLAIVAAPLAFTVLMRALPRDAGWILLISVMGFAGAQAGARILGPQLGACLGAFVVGLASNLYERFRRHPATVPLVPSVLLLVPGSVGFRSLTELLDRHVISGVGTAFTMFLTAISLVAGLLLANILLPPRAAVARARHMTE